MRCKTKSKQFVVMGAKRDMLIHMVNNSGMQKKDLAAAIGIAENTLRNWENGTTYPRPTIQQVDKMCDLFGCDRELLIIALEQ